MRELSLEEVGNESEEERREEAELHSICRSIMGCGALVRELVSLYPTQYTMPLPIAVAGEMTQSRSVARQEHLRGLLIIFSCQR